MAPLALALATTIILLLVLFVLRIPHRVFMWVVSVLNLDDPKRYESVLQPLWERWDEMLGSERLAALLLELSSFEVVHHLLTRVRVVSVVLLAWASIIRPDTWVFVVVFLSFLLATMVVMRVPDSRIQANAPDGYETRLDFHALYSVRESFVANYAVLHAVWWLLVFDALLLTYYTWW